MQISGDHSFHLTHTHKGLEHSYVSVFENTQYVLQKPPEETGHSLYVPHAYLTAFFPINHIFLSLPCLS